MDLITFFSQMNALYPESFAQKKLEKIADKDWERICLQDFKPLQFGKNLWICPSWLETPDKNAVNIILDPGLAFGTGTHPTTALCLDYLANHNIKDKIVIDYGTGSGILAIACLKLEAKAVYAVDIHPQAILASKRNAKKNQVLEKLFLDFPEKLPDIQADLVIANILMEPILELKDHFKNLLFSSGFLVLSGLLATQEAMVLKTYEKDFKHLETKQEDDWIRIILQKISP